ncbi:MAG: CRISP-associated protein Cas1 [Bacillota bacterium]|nr:MAG: CRISP-associated protein Cas1 [Bacillota bacterium]
MEIIVDNFGSFVGKKSERLVVKNKDSIVVEEPFFKIESITLASGGISISTDAIEECMTHGIQINLMSPNGKVYGVIHSPHVNATIVTRRAQLLAAMDSRGIELVKAIISGKVHNQINTLKYFAKHLKENRVELHEFTQTAVNKMDKHLSHIRSLESESLDDLRPIVFAAEGQAADTYWKTVAEILKGKVEIPGREHRGATDPFNMFLNYGYGILYGRIWGAISTAGLDPYAGFLHVDRSGKASMVLDFIEEFRQAIVDRVAIASFSRGFDMKQENGQLTIETRSEIAKRVSERLDSTDSYDGKKYKLSNIIHAQSRKLASFLRGEGKYTSHIAGW